MKEQDAVAQAAQRGGESIKQPHAPQKHRVTVTVEVEVPAGGDVFYALSAAAGHKINEQLQAGRTLVLDGQPKDAPTIARG